MKDTKFTYIVGGIGYYNLARVFGSANEYQPNQLERQKLVFNANCETKRIDEWYINLRTFEPIRRSPKLFSQQFPW